MDDTNRATSTASFFIGETRGDVHSSCDHWSLKRGKDDVVRKFNTHYVLS